MFLETAIRRAWSQRSLRKIGRDTADTVVDRVRQGFGSERGQKRRLKPLSKSYIDRRRKSSLASTTSAAKSNLTFTGGLLASIKAKVKGTTITIGPTGQENQKKAQAVSVDRPFLSLTKKEERKMVKDVEKELIKQVDRIFR